MPSNFTKQPQQLNQVRYMNDGAGDSVIGGQITSVPSGVVASQGIQDIPGDRIILGHMDAYALSDSTVGLLYGGLYQYVTTYASSTASPGRGQLAFWRNATTTPQAYNNYVVSADEATQLIAGVFISSPTKGNSWWIQIAGFASIKFLTTITGTPTVNRGVFAAYAGAGSDVGRVDQFVGASTAVTTGGATNVGIDSLLANYVGSALVLPQNNTISLVWMPTQWINY